MIQVTLVKYILVSEPLKNKKVLYQQVFFEKQRLQ